MNGQALRESMRRWATGVAVVTSRSQETEHGMTVNSFTSVSLEPPLVMVAMEQASRTCAMISQSGIFGVTILARDQQAIAERFAGRDGGGQNRFDDIPIQRLESGLAFISGGLAFLDCQIYAAYQIGSHTLFIGQVMDVRTASEAFVDPLLYFNRGYQQIAAQGKAIRVIDFSSETRQEI